jgi:hypothetical protein
MTCQHHRRKVPLPLPPRSPRIDITAMGEAEMTSTVRLLDDACTAILEGFRAGWRNPSELNVSSAAYDTLARIRRDEVARGNPLMLLGLTVVRDRSLEDGRTTITWSRGTDQEKEC